MYGFRAQIVYGFRPQLCTDCVPRISKSEIREPKAEKNRVRIPYTLFVRFWFSEARSRSVRGCGRGLGRARSGPRSDKLGEGFDGRFSRLDRDVLGRPKNALFGFSGKQLWRARDVQL